MSDFINIIIIIDSDYYIRQISDLFRLDFIS